METSSDSPSPRFSLLVIYGLVLIISQNAISSCCWRSNRGETSAGTPTTPTLPVHAHNNVTELRRNLPQTAVNLLMSLFFSYDSIFIIIWF